MAMSKTERAAFDKVKLDATIYRALRWSPETSIEPDVDIPDGHCASIATGFLFNSYNDGRIEKAWSRSNSHGIGKPPEPGRYGTGSQNGRRLYASEILALRAMRCEMEMRFARILASVDARIEVAKETP
jgi:hypothetical protein